MANSDDQLVHQELQAAIDALRVLPPENPAAVARIVAAARAQRGPHLIPNVHAGRHARHWWQGFKALLAAGVVFGVGFLVGDSGGPFRSDLAEFFVPPSSGDVITQVAMHTEAPTNPGIPVPTVFQVVAPAARRVAVVGDFNAWDSAAAPLTRSPEGVWQGTIPLLPGRHSYAFLIDDQIVPDPHALNMRDPDYDVLVSTLVVKEAE